LEYVDPSKGCGLEIGAFDLPLVEPAEGRCDFADWNTADYLRDVAKSRPGHCTDFVVSVRFDLRQGGYGQIPEGYDWAGAAHVIEHVPDIVRWLTQVSAKLKPGGILFLVIPDKRYTYDYYRRESTFTDALVAYRYCFERPSFAQVFDHHYYTCPAITARDMWAGNRLPHPKLDFAGAVAQAEKAEHSYQDAHCWVLTPDNFRSLFRSLIDAQMTNLKLEDLHPTVSGGIDFSVVLCKSVQI
jgi:hypothetical protein